MHEIQPRLVGACSILVGDVELTPGASHLFALLLAFSLSPKEPWTRRALQDLLFADTEERQASHRLRQLLYRLRGFGVALQESSNGVIRMANPVADPLAGLATADLASPSQPSARTDPLGLYAPRMPAPFLEWLEERRDALRTSLTARRLTEMRAARERQDYASCAQLAETLYALEPLNEEIVVAAAESFAMLGRRDAALDFVDQFVRDTGESIEMHASLKRLRTRIASTRIPRREGTLRGREECLALLSEQWELAKGGGGGRVCAIFAAPGMGKSRIGETVSAAIRLAGGQVLQHRCDSQARPFPLSLFSQLVPELRSRRGSIGADPALSGALDQLAPGSGSPVPTARTGTASERREEVRRAIVDLIEAVSAEQPVLIVVDDAHLLDEASRGVVRGIVESVNSAQVLVVLLCRPRPDGQTLLSTSPRFTTLALTPLSADDSRALLLEVSTHRRPTEAELDWAVGQAGGNAFYLHALAHHPCENVSLPAHVKSLAQSSYLGVSPDARTVLDTCLLLDTLASPARVARVAGMDDRLMLAAVRELEDSDLLRYEDGLFAGPHAIIRDVLDAMMPTTSRALLHHRIAELLSAECDDPARARVVAWGAVSSWLACGDSVAAVDLALQVAREAAGVGEPEAGALLLSQLPTDRLALETQRLIMDEIIRMADAGKCLTLLSRTLRERSVLAARSGEGSSAAADFTLQALSCDHLAGKLYDIREAERIAFDRAVAPTLRAVAVARLMAEADLQLDPRVAEGALLALTANSETELQDDPNFIRAQLVYHTAFGSARTALVLCNKLLTTFPNPSLEASNRASRSYAAFGLLRLGCYEACASVSREGWEFMRKANHLLAAEYFGAVAAEAHLNLGDFDRSREIIAELRGSVSRRPSTDRLASMVYSSEIVLAIADGDPDEASRLLDEVEQTNPSLATPRHRGISLAHRVRISQLRGKPEAAAAELRELVSTFSSVQALGGRDSMAEAIWHAYEAVGNRHGASQMLHQYLQLRRELGSPEARLRITTASDPVWKRSS